ncbi:MAG TPA: hypothetical protein VGB98_13915 [Pyrinomonadaceae bacterium]|jgi:hypothetical protein
MTNPNPSKGRASSRPAPVLAALALYAVAALCLAPAAPAQSGRKAQKPLNLPTEAPKQGETPGAKPEAKKVEAVLSLVVMRADDATAFGIDSMARDGVASAFSRRLGQVSSVEVRDGGKGRRQEARARAREEKKAYVVLFQLDEQAGGMTTGNVDSRTLVIRTFVYSPQTGDLKYTDTIYQRPYQDSARVGGVRIPVPSRRVDRYPSQHELEQAARDAADRLLGRFQVTPPPER